MYPLVKTRYYYASGNTAKGFVNYLHSNIHDIKKIFVLHHSSHKIKTVILNNLINYFKTKNNLEIIHSPFGSEFLEGMIIREKSLAIITDTIHSDDIHDTKDIIIPYKQGDVKRYQSEKRKENEHLEEAYQYLSTALTIHDDLEKIYINEMDFSKADEITENLIQKLLLNVPKNNRTPHIYRRLFGTTTAEGSINIVPQIIKDLSQRIFLKGRAGTGKSVFMKKVAQACENHGFDLEIYHCSFDPESVDMVLVPELSFCIFDSTNPHEFFPEDDRDTVVDLYEHTVTPGTDEKYVKEINEVTKRYKTFIKKGMQSLQEAKMSLNQIEKNYENVEQAELQTITQQILKQFT